jgi:hypothetical protein
MGKTVAAQMHAAIPAGDHDDVTGQPLALQHLQNHRTRPGLAIVALQRPALAQDRGQL